MFFVAQLAGARSKTLSAVPAKWRGIGPAGSATVTEDVATCVPGDWLAPTAADEMVAGASNSFAIPAGSNAIERNTGSRGLCGVLEHIRQPPRPRSPLFAPSGGASKLN